MANISVKDVPEAWAEALRQRAARNHRSLQGELMAIIEAALVNTVPMVPVPTPGAQDVVVGYGAGGYPIVRKGWKTVQQVAAELKALYPNGPAPGQGSSIDMIREDRDSR
jgi:plasmid stability protein